MQAGCYVAQRPEIKDTLGFHVSAFCSPDISWEDIAVDLLTALHEKGRGNMGAMQKFTNDREGRGFRHEHKKQEAQEILARIRHVERGTVPDDMEILTLGIDVQGAENGVWWSLVASKREGPTAHVVDWGHIGGEFSRIGPAIDAIITRVVKNESGLERRISRVFLDSGDGNRRTDVYRFCLRYAQGRAVRPIKGGQERSRFFHENTDAREPHGGLLVNLNEVGIKDTIAAWLARKPDDPHAMTFPPQVRDDLQFQEHLTSEQRTDKTKGGGQWEGIEGKENHLWDATVYAVGAAIMMGLVGVPTIQAPPPPSQPTQKLAKPPGDLRWGPRPGW
jgi:phage terminase large subunit GpA-like protein